MDKYIDYDHVYYVFNKNIDIIYYTFMVNFYYVKKYLNIINY